MQVIITAPSLDASFNVSGISSVTQFIIRFNTKVDYIHFELGKRDQEKRNIIWLIRILKTYYKWIALMLTLRNAAIHFNMAVDAFGLLRDSPLILLAKGLKKHIIIHLHGGAYLLYKEPSKWMKILIRITLAGKSPIVVLSAEEAEALQKKYNCKNIFVLPNSVDVYSASIFKRTPNLGEDISLLFMGRISAQKGLEYIYQAFEVLKKQGHMIKFFMAGKGPEEKEYVQKFSKLLGADFKYEGIVTGEAKINLLKKCNVFVLPSFFEGMPIALLESMSFGLVPITTNVGSIKYLIRDGNNGLIVARHSANDIVNAINRLSIDAHFRYELSSNARKTILFDYNPSNYLVKLNRIYAYE